MPGGTDEEKLLASFLSAFLFDAQEKEEEEPSIEQEEEERHGEAEQPPDETQALEKIHPPSEKERGEEEKGSSLFRASPLAEKEVEEEDVHDIGRRHAGTAEEREEEEEEEQE